MPIPDPVSQPARAARRRKMAAEVQSVIKKSTSDADAIHAAIAEVAGRHSVNLATVRNACRENGVEVPRKPAARVGPTKQRTLRVVAALMAGPAGRGDATEAEIARKFKISRERVRQIKEGAVKAGVLRG